MSAVVFKKPVAMSAKRQAKNKKNIKGSPENCAKKPSNALKFKNHTKSFYDMLKKYKPNYETLSKQISNLKY